MVTLLLLSGFLRFGVVCVVCFSVLCHHTKHVTPTLNWGHALAEVVSFQPLIHKASPFVIGGGQVALGQVFLQVNHFFFVCEHHSINALYLFSHLLLTL